MIKRVLHIVGRMNRGGAETFIMNVYRGLNRNQIQFDFVVHTLEICDYEEEILKLGGTIYHITPISKNIFKHIKELSAILKDKKYKAVHRHTNSAIVFIDLLISKIFGVTIRIAHSHCDRTLTSGIIHSITRPLLNFLATDKLACSDAAGKWLYGDRTSYKVICNGIDLNNFKFDISLRTNTRNVWGVDEKIIIGHVGRFSYAKNHKFIIDVFNKASALNQYVELWLIGEGELKNEIYNKVIKLGIERQVRFFESRSDINKMLQAMDVFLFPSNYEGLGVAIIEAQVSGLHCLISDTIPETVDISDRITRLSLMEDVSVWAEKLFSIDLYNREIDLSNSKIQNFNIKIVISILNNIYLG